VAFDYGAPDRVVDPGSVDGRDHCARAYGVDADAVGSVFERQGSGEIVEGAFADGIREIGGLGNDLVDARIVHDNAATGAGEEVPDGFARAEERTAQIDVEDAIEVVGGGFVAGGGELDSGVVDEDIEAAEVGDSLLHHVFDFGFHGYVRLNEDGTSTCLDKSCVSFRPFRGTAIIQGDVRPFLGEAEGDGAADAGRCPGNQHILSGEAFHPLYCRE